MLTHGEDSHPGDDVLGEGPDVRGTVVLSSLVADAHQGDDVVTDVDELLGSVLGRITGVPAHQPAGDRVAAPDDPRGSAPLDVRVEMVQQRVDVPAIRGVVDRPQALMSL